MTAGELLNINSILQQDENAFELWPASEYHNHAVLTLRSKYGFRRFKITNVNAELSELQQKAIEIDEALCQKEILPEYKKYLGLHFIPI